MGKNTNKKTKKVKISELIKFCWDVFFTDTNKVLQEKLSIEEWFERELKNNNPMYLYVGEFCVSLQNDAMIKNFIEAIKRGKRITIICWDMILGDVYGKNAVFEYIKTQKPVNVNLRFLKISDKEHFSIFHFYINGRNILLELPHLPSEGTLNNKITIIKNSVIWFYRLKPMFNELLEKADTSIKDIVVKTTKEFIQEENENEFLKKLITDVLKNKTYIQ